MNTPSSRVRFWPKLAAGLVLASLGAIQPHARASIAYGSINNFDTVNDTGTVCHGFEIEIEDCRSTDITYTYNYNHYGCPNITQDDSVAAHPKCVIRWASKKNPDGSWAAHTAIPSGPIAPTNGHMFTNPAVNFGGEHFGVGYRVAVGAIRYNWLVDNGSGALIHGGAVQVSTPTFTYFPPVAGNPAPAQVQAVIAPPPPPAPEPKEFGKAVWVKEIRTSSHNNQEIKLRELVSDDPDDANDKNWANGEPDEVEVEWRILQTKTSAPDGGPNNELVAAPEDLPNGDEVVTRRYEFYKYAGPLDAETGEAMADVVGLDGIHGTGMRTYADHRNPANGEWVKVTEDMATKTVVGDFVGSQMAAVDVQGAVGLIDHVGEGATNTPYAARTVVVQGALPFTATQEGALPPGMVFNEVTGVLSGTPAASGTYHFKVAASDGANPDVSKNYTLQVAAAGAALPPACLLDTAAEPLGAGTTTGDGSYAVGANATVTATPANGYTFLHWTDNGAIVSPDATFNQIMDVNHSLVANFAASGTSYTVAASANPAAGGSVGGAGVVAEGAAVNLVATPHAGYAFVDWTEGGISVSNSASYSFPAAADRTLVANFVLTGGMQRTVSLGANPAESGVVTGAGTYADGASVTVVATANPGYKFSKWKEGGSTVSTSASYTFTVTANRSLVASFEPVFTVTASSSPPSGGSTEADSAGYKDGETALVKAFPAAGYQFTRWSENGVTVSSANPYEFTVSGDRSLVAHFSLIGGVTVTTSASPAAGGSTSGDGSFMADDSVVVIATPAPGYGFVNWTEGSVPVSANASYTFNVNVNRSLVANFSLGYTIGTTASPGEGGTASGGGFVPAGASVTLTATANPGYSFVNWTDAPGTEVSPDPSYTFTPAADGVFTAHFALLPSEFAFDFDTATPVLAAGQALPLDQTTAGHTITCSSPQAAAFAVATEAASGQVLSKFSGRYLASLADGASLVIQFAQPVTGVSIDFATVEAVDVPVAADLRLTAVDNSSGSPVEAGTGIAHGAVVAGDTLPTGTLNFNSASGSFDEIRLQMRDASSVAIRFLVDNLIISPASSTGGSILLENPNWNVTLTDSGYSDFLLDNTPGFEGREYLSGEWGSAVGYTRNGQSYAPVWFEPDFVFPDWRTNSNFHVVRGIHLAGTNLDGLPIAESVIANNDLQITLRYEMVDTVTGTPMGVAATSGAPPGESVSSNRYVLSQTFTVQNISGESLTAVQLFQLLHGLNSQHGQFDNRSYPGKLAEYQYDLTMAGLDASAAGGQSSSAGVEDLIGFHSKVAPSAFEIGYYGVAGNGIDDHSLGKPSDGVHLSIENNWQSAPYLARKNRDSFSPASGWVGGAQRWDLGNLAPGQSVSFESLSPFMLGVNDVVVLPQVGLSTSTPGTLDVQWPDSFTGWTLQESTNLSTWVNSARAVTRNGGTSSVAVPVASGVRFFRLRRP